MRRHAWRQPSRAPAKPGRGDSIKSFGRFGFTYWVVNFLLAGHQRRLFVYHALESVRGTRERVEHFRVFSFEGRLAGSEILGGPLCLVEKFPGFVLHHLPTSDERSQVLLQETQASEGSGSTPPKSPTYLSLLDRCLVRPMLLLQDLQVLFTQELFHFRFLQFDVYFLRSVIHWCTAHLLLDGSFDQILKPKLRNSISDSRSFLQINSQSSTINGRCSRVVTGSYFRNFLTWPNAIIFFCGSLVELRKKFENTSFSVYRRGVSIITKGQFSIYFGQNRKFYWLCRRFPWLFLTDYILLTFLTCDIPVLINGFFDKLLFWNCDFLIKRRELTLEMHRPLRTIKARQTLCGISKENREPVFCTYPVF